MNIAGRILLVAALGLAGYALFYFNIYMENGYGNLGLMDDRRNIYGRRKEGRKINDL